MVSKESILSALSAITDPDFKKDIVTLGFVKNIEISGENVSFDIELTTPACPVKQDFKERAERAVSSLPGVKNVAVNMTSRKKHTVLNKADSGLRNVRSIIAVSSCKGGVGKSTIAAFLASEVSRRGFATGLLDTDLFGPSLPTLFNLHNVEIKEEQGMVHPATLGNLKLLSFGFLTGDEPAVMRGPMVSNYINTLLHKVEWGDLDYLFLDLPPGTGDIQLTITQSVQVDGAVIVTTPQALSMVDVGKGILMFDKVNVPVIGVVENMAYFICDNCEKKHFIFGGDAADALQKRFGIDILSRLPVSDTLTSGFNGFPGNALVTELVDNVIRGVGKLNSRKEEKPEIEFNENRISLHWKDKRQLTVNNFELRANCQCANCIHEMTGESLLHKEDIPADIHPVEINTIGNYAISVKWSDGHSTGFFSYSLIESLAGKNGRT